MHTDTAYVDQAVIFTINLAAIDLRHFRASFAAPQILGDDKLLLELASVGATKEKITECRLIVLLKGP